MRDQESNNSDGGDEHREQSNRAVEAPPSHDDEGPHQRGAEVQNIGPTEAISMEQSSSHLWLEDLQLSPEDERNEMGGDDVAPSSAHENNQLDHYRFPGLGHGPVSSNQALVPTMATAASTLGTPQGSPPRHPAPQFQHLLSGPAHRPAPYFVQSPFSMLSSTGVRSINSTMHSARFGAIGDAIAAGSGGQQQVPEQHNFLWADHSENREAVSESAVGQQPALNAPEEGGEQRWHWFENDVPLSVPASDAIEAGRLDGDPHFQLELDFTLFDVDLLLNTRRRVGTGEVTGIVRRLVPVDQLEQLLLQQQDQQLNQQFLHDQQLELSPQELEDEEEEPDEPPGQVISDTLLVRANYPNLPPPPEAPRRRPPLLPFPDDDDQVNLGEGPSRMPLPRPLDVQEEDPGEGHSGTPIRAPSTPPPPHALPLDDDEDPGEGPSAHPPIGTSTPTNRSFYTVEEARTRANQVNARANVRPRKTKRDQFPNLRRRSPNNRR